MDSIAFDLKKLDQFPKNAEDYLSDNFVFRTPLIAANKTINLSVFSVSPDKERLIIGKNNRLFIASEERMIYEGKRNFNSRQINVFKKEWKRRKSFFDKRKIAFYWMVAPTALEVYLDYLPMNVVNNNPFSRTQQLKHALKNVLPFQFIDLKNALINEKEKNDVYFKNDNHWNKRGGYVCAELFLKTLRKDHQKNLSLDFLKSIRWFNKKSTSGYLKDVYGDSTRTEWVPELRLKNETAFTTEKYNFPIPSYFMYPQDYERRFVNTTTKNKLKILIITDSFGDAVFPILKEAFAETLIIFDSWEYKLNESIIEQYKPDVVLFLTYETHIENLIKNAEKP